MSYSAITVLVIICLILSGFIICYRFYAYCKNKKIVIMRMKNETQNDDAYFLEMMFMSDKDADFKKALENLDECLYGNWL